MTFGELLRLLTPRAPVHTAIIAANCLVFGIMVATGVNWSRPAIDDLIRWGANFGPLTVNGEPWRLLSCAFIHVGLMHLVVNMWCLRDLGELVERLVGPVGFLILYILSGLGGSLCSLAYSPTIVSAGASGAIFGVVGALFGVILRRKRWFPPAMIALTRRNALIFLVANTAITFFVPQIDIAAHLGGAAVGILCGWALGHPLRLEAVPGRLRRNVALAVVGTVVIGIAYFMVKQHLGRVSDPNLDLQYIGEAEAQADARVKEIAEASDAHQITDDECFERINDEILRPWRNVVRRVDEMKRLPSGSKLTLAQLRAYVRLREERWELLGQYFRSRDPALLVLCHEKDQEAAKIAR